MAGELNLSKLLQNMEPQLTEQTWVFCHLPEKLPPQYQSYNPLADEQVIASYREREGLTLVLSAARADELNLNYEGLFRCITLNVHSSLEAVGLTAAVSGQLTSRGISANVIAAFYHDHVFVQAQRAEEALQCLRELVAKA